MSLLLREGAVAALLTWAGAMVMMAPPEELWVVQIQWVGSRPKVSSLGIENSQSVSLRAAWAVWAAQVALGPGAWVAAAAAEGPGPGLAAAAAPLGSSAAPLGGGAAPLGSAGKTGGSTAPLGGGGVPPLAAGHFLQTSLQLGPWRHCSCCCWSPGRGGGGGAAPLGGGGG